MCRRIQLLVASICLIGVAGAQAAVIDVHVATNKRVYAPREPILISVTASNPHERPVRLVFPTSHQAGYVMDDRFDWASDKAFLQVFTYVTLEPGSAHRWVFEHDWAAYPPVPGGHWVNGYIVGYGRSDPVRFEVLLPGDITRSGRVDGEDFLIWQANFGRAEGAEWDEGDLNGDGRIDGEDFLIWQSHFGLNADSPPSGQAAELSTLTPEPMAMSLLVLAGAGLLGRQRYV